jgi:hypothetical protein
MNSKLLWALLLLSMSSVTMSAKARAEECRGPLTVEASMSGHYNGPASVQGIKNSMLKRLKSRFAQDSARTYGARFKYMARGICGCVASTRRARIGTPLSLHCELTARACDHPYVYMEGFRCPIRVR